MKQTNIANEKAAEAEQVLLKIIRRPELERVTGLPHSSIYEMIAKGEFPRPIRLSGRAVGWLANEVIEWQQSRVAARVTREAT